MYSTINCSLDAKYCRFRIPISSIWKSNSLLTLRASVVNCLETSWISGGSVMLSQNYNIQYLSLNLSNVCYGSYHFNRNNLCIHWTGMFILIIFCSHIVRNFLVNIPHIIHTKRLLIQYKVSV